jgi:hypothetical protein
MLDRRDFDEWFAREQARTNTPIGLAEKGWAEAGFFAAQTLIRKQVRRANMREVNNQTAALLKRANKL